MARNEIEHSICRSALLRRSIPGNRVSVRWVPDKLFEMKRFLVFLYPEAPEFGLLCAGAWQNGNPG